MEKQPSSLVNQTSEQTTPGELTPKRKISLSAIFFTLFILLLLLALGGETYFMFKQRNKYVQQINDKNSTISEKDTEIADLNTTKTQLEDEKATLEGENATLTTQTTDYQTKLNKLKAYNDFLIYEFQVIALHGGVYNLTEAEYEQGLQKAELTGDSDFIQAVTDAWENKSISPTVRFFDFMNFTFDKMSTYAVI